MWPNPQVAKLDMPEAADKQRREKFVLSVAYSPGGRTTQHSGAQRSMAQRSMSCWKKGELPGLFWLPRELCLRLVPARKRPPSMPPRFHTRPRPPAPTPPQRADGRRIAAGGMDGTVALFDAASGKLLHTLDGHFKPVRDLCFTPGKLVRVC